MLIKNYIYITCLLNLFVVRHICTQWHLVKIDKRALAFYQDVTFSPVHIIISDYSVYNYLLKFHPFISFSYPKFGHDGARLSAISQMSLLPGPSRDPTMLPNKTIYIFSLQRVASLLWVSSQLGVLGKPLREGTPEA